MTAPLLLPGVDGGAMPFCDVFLPAHSLTALRRLFTALAL